jgi:hypothetical protein
MEESQAAEDYRTLELAFNAPLSEVDRAWKKLVLVRHPDKRPREEKEVAEDDFKRLRGAHERLMSRAEPGVAVSSGRKTAENLYYEMFGNLPPHVVLFGGGSQPVPAPIRLAVGTRVKRKEDGKRGKLVSVNGWRHVVSLDGGEGQIAVPFAKLQQIVEGVVIVDYHPDLDGKTGTLEGCAGDTYLLDNATRTLPFKNVLLPNGTIVSLVGLQQNKELNYCTARIVASEGGKYEVDIGGRRGKVNFDNVRA